MLDLNNGEFVKHVVFHPVEGFEDLRWKKKGSIPIAVGIVVLFFVQAVAYGRLYGFQYYVDYDKWFNIVPYLVQSVIIFCVWVVANWAMCTLFDGEGTMRRIFIYSAYALVPYIVCSLANTILSHVLVEDEAIFMTTINIVGLIWSIALMLSAMKSVHQFSIGKTLLLILLTFVAMIAILFLLVLLLTLFQQVIIFILSIYTELSYRIRM
jgi:hypothetical protein